MPAQKPPALAAGCGVLFGLPFIVMGLFFAAMAAKGALARPGGGALQWLPVGFGLLFAGVGALVSGGALWGARRMAAEQARRAVHAGEPWRWREDWEAGRVVHRARGAAVGPWIFALFWNAVSLPAVVLGLPKILAEGKWAGLLLLLFPLIGAGLLAWAIHATLRAIRFGDSTLRLETVPAPVGGALRGAVAVRGDWALTHGARLRLINLRRVTTGSGKNRSTRETVVTEWTGELAGAGLYAGPDGIVLPIDAAVPVDGEPTDGADANNQVLWRLEVRSPDIPGVDYFAAFEVPVFGRETRRETAPATAPGLPGDATPAPANFETRIEPDPRGGVAYHLRPFRNPGTALVFLLLTLAGFAGLGFMIAGGLPFVPILIVGVFVLVFAMVALDLCFAAQRLSAVDGRLSFRGGFLARGKPREWAAGEIAGFFVKQGMTAGSTAYHDVWLRPRAGREVVLLRNLRDRREAAWLASDLARALGLPG